MSNTKRLTRRRLGPFPLRQAPVYRAAVRRAREAELARFEAALLEHAAELREAAKEERQR